MTTSVTAVLLLNGSSFAMPRCWRRCGNYWITCIMMNVHVGLCQKSLGHVGKIVRRNSLCYCTEQMINGENNYGLQDFSEASLKVLKMIPFGCLVSFLHMQFIIKVLLFFL